jgi:MFS family permease
MTTIGALHAYMADCTDSGSRLNSHSLLVVIFADVDQPRSRIFSLFLGLVFIGVALGPTLASLLIHFTHQAMSIFYVAAGMHLFYLLWVGFVIPESLSPSQMNASVVRWREKMAQARNGAGNLKMVFGFLTPLTIFLPQRDSKNPLNGRRDWSLTLLVIAYGCTVSLMVCLNFRCVPLLELYYFPGFVYV